MGLIPITKYEKEIYNTVNASRQHMTADQIYGRLRERYPGVSLATVYNNLHKLCEVNLIRKISVEGAVDRYDHIGKHDHLVCQKCGKLMDISLTDLTASLQEQLGGEFLYYDLKVYVLCPDCRAKETADDPIEPLR